MRLQKLLEIVLEQTYAGEVDIESLVQELANDYYLELGELSQFAELQEEVERLEKVELKLLAEIEELELNNEKNSIKAKPSA